MEKADEKRYINMKKVDYSSYFCIKNSENMYYLIDFRISLLIINEKNYTFIIT